MTTFLGVQLAFDLPPDHRLRRALAEAVRRQRAAEGLTAQRVAWTTSAGLLHQAVPHAVLGTWDLITPDGEAEYEDWASGLEAMAHWSPEDFGADGRYLLASVIVVVRKGSNADRTLGDLCDVAEPDWHRRATYQRLVEAMPQLNLTNVLGSGFYLAPHPDRPGFAIDVLQGEGFDYLAAVEG